MQRKPLSPELNECCDEVIDKLVVDLRVLASNYFMKTAINKHQTLMRQFDRRISTFAKRRRTK